VTKLADYQPIDTLFESSVSCQKVARRKKLCRQQEGLLKITFMAFRHENIKQFGSPYAAKENNIEQLLNLAQMQHPNIVQVKNVFHERHTLTIVTDYFDTSSLFGFICSQKLYLSEKLIA